MSTVQNPSGSPLCNANLSEAVPLAVLFSAHVSKDQPALVAVAVAVAALPVISQTETAAPPHLPVLLGTSRHPIALAALPHTIEHAFETQ